MRWETVLLLALPLPALWLLWWSVRRSPFSPLYHDTDSDPDARMTSANLGCFACMTALCLCMWWLVCLLRVLPRK